MMALQEKLVDQQCRIHPLEINNVCTKKLLKHFSQHHHKTTRGKAY